MIVLLDTSHDLNEAAAELGCDVEQLLTPLTRYKRQQPGNHFAIDNGAFSGFERKNFLSLLQRESHAKNLCRFVVVPDVVGSARRTLEIFENWTHQLPGWKLALAIQDGIESLPIPWASLDAVFIGGSTEFKLGKHAADVIKAAKALNKWVHAGRVNRPGRFEYFENLGADSIDGTGLSRFSWMRKQIYEMAIQPNLLDRAMEESDGNRKV